MFSTGVLYSARSFLDLVAENEFPATEFPEMYRTFEVASAVEVLDVAQRCNWVSVNEAGILCLTERGTILRRLDDYQACLREQLVDLIVTDNPPWVRQTTKGRDRTLGTMPDDALQCLKESELDVGETDEIVDWWDRVSLLQRGMASEASLKTGRQGEKLSIDYETSRTGRKPEWVALETSIPGYDLKSSKNKDDTTDLRIEVKTTTNNLNNADFFLTKNEYRSALRNQDEYTAHLWVLTEPVKGFFATANELLEHVPDDRGDGKWELVKIPFSLFKDNKLEAEHLA